jgi:glycine oxidase
LQISQFFLPDVIILAMRHRDFLIVGQGLAGTVLAYLLWKAGKSVAIIDQTKENEPSSSKIAAGVVNPITGRRFVKSWRFEELNAAARPFYAEIEQLLGVKIWHDRRLFRTIQTIEEENNWALRSTMADYAAFCGDITPSVPELDEHFLNPVHAFSETKNVAQVNIPLFLNRMRHFFADLDMFIEARFDTRELVVEERFVMYDDIQATKVIFTDGALGATNDFFNWLPFNLDKGELLLIKIPNWSFNGILKSKISIVPLHDTEGGEKDLCWVGATNDWNFENEDPTESNKQLIINDLQQILKVPFEIIAHRSAVRPTVKDRRPFIGSHPNFSTLTIFNGFGTKGASLIPFWAEHFKNHLLIQTPLDKEVDVRRFY